MDLTKENGVEIFKRRMIFARQLGAETIITNAAPRIRQRQFYDNIRELGAFAATIGIKIGLENPGDGSANILDTAEQAAAVIDAINLQTVGLNYDFGNLISHRFEKLKPEQDYRRALPQINHYHIKDVVRLDRGWGFCAIGDGIIDYRQILTEIAKDPRPLPVSLEIPLRLERAADASPIRYDQAVDRDLIRQALRASMNFVRQSLDIDE
jgi:sugar phosphate isomerase/epimerase